MCGIFGIISQQTVTSEQFSQLADANKHRGNLAFGYITGETEEGDVNTAVYRYAQPFSPHLVQLEQANIALGHIRAPTGRQSPSLDDVHPFATENLFLAHNGLLLNHQQFPTWQLYPNSQVDSQVILGGIQAYCQEGLPVAQAIQATVAQLEGQQACWLWTQSPAALYLWRVMSPIFIHQTGDSFAFSSSRHLQIDTLVPEGFIFRLDPFSLSWEVVAEFPYYSPYRT